MHLSVKNFQSIYHSVIDNHVWKDGVNVSKGKNSANGAKF